MGINFVIIQKYLNGKLDPKQMHELEKQALSDPFLAEAMEGYAYTKKPVEHQLSILQRQLEERIAVQQQNKDNFNFTWQRLSIAAAAGLMFITVAILFVMDTENKNSKVASIPEKVNVELNSGSGTAERKTLPEVTLSSKQEKIGGSLKSPTIASLRTANRSIVNNVPVHAESVAQIAAANPDSKNASNGLNDVTISQNQEIAKSSGNSAGTGVNSAGKPAGVIGDGNQALNEVVVTAPPPSNSKEEALSSTIYLGAQPLVGWQKYQEYLEKNILYSKLKTKVVGNVVVGFKVNSKGRPTDLHIVRSLNRLYDAEAIRLIRKGSGWKFIGPNNTSEVNVTVNFAP